MGDPSLLPLGNLLVPPLQGGKGDASLLPPGNSPASSLQGGKGDASSLPPGDLPAPTPLLGGNSGGVMGTRGGCNSGNDHVGVDGGVLAAVVPPPPGNATLPDARTLTTVDLAANNPVLLLAIQRSPQ
jgi:hypothetical protein